MANRRNAMNTQNLNNNWPIGGMFKIESSDIAGLITYNNLQEDEQVCARSCSSLRDRGGYRRPGDRDFPSQRGRDKKRARVHSIA